jgi:polysaccharide biosynthesis/export protein
MKVIFSLFILLLTACAGNVNYANKTVSISDLKDRPTRIVSDYQIGIGDTMQINVWKNADLNVTVPVRPDGKVSAPLIGEMLVAGLTPEVVSLQIEERLSKFIRTPNVVVIMTSLESTEYLSRIRVTGAVVNNISLNHRQGMTVLDAVLEAGGPNEFANQSGAKVFRRIQGETVLIPINLESILIEGNLAENIILQPGDTITVPERGL